jgi:HD superfamily phosphohydrolase
MILGKTRNKFDRNRCIIELLNNKESKIDLDKLDYLNRDTYYYDSSVRYLDYEGIISGLRIINLNDSYELCYSYDLKEEIDKLFERRFYNHYNIYQNLEVKKWELSYLELLSEHEYSIKNIFINNFDIDNFCKLSDESFKIYKCIYKIYGNSFQNNDEINIGKKIIGTNLLLKDYEVNHGAKNENPVNKIIFYEKNNSIIKLNENNKNYNEIFKYLCYKDQENLKHDLSKYKEIYDKLVISHAISFVNTGL